MDEKTGEHDREDRTVRETLDDFEDTRTARTPYVPPGYEVTDAPGPDASDPASPGRRERDGGSDARDGVLDVLNREDAAVVLVAGESGIGKSRLLAEVGRAIRESGGTVRYVRPPCAEPPSIDGDAVLLLDDAERLARPGRFLRLPAEADGAVQVVAAVRQVHRRSLDAGVVPDAVPRYDLTIDPLDADRTVDLLADRDVPEDRARAIQEAAGGNPALTLHLARSGAEATAEGVASALDDAVETAVADADLGTDAGTARRLLRAVAVLGAYAPGAADDEAGGLPLDDPDDRRRVLDSLRDAGLLDAVEDASGERGGAKDEDDSTFALHSSVVAEHCRSRALDDGAALYGALLDARLATDAPGIAHGLVDLRRSALLRVGALDGSEVAADTRPLLEDVAGGVVDADASLADALCVGALVNLVAPDAVPHAELAARCEEGAAPETAGAMYRLAAGTYRHASATATDEYDLPVPAATLFAHARTWLDRLNGLAIDRPDDAFLQHRLARALREAAASERAAGNFDGAGTCLDRLDVLAEDNGGVTAVQVVLATALRDAIGAAGEAGRVDDIGTHLDRLSGLADAHLDHDAIRRALAVALVNATGYGGAAGVDTLQARLDRLSDLADAHPDDEDLQHRLAQALLNVTSAEARAGRFEALDAHLDRLSDLADANPESAAIRHRFAQALLSAVDHGAKAERFDDLAPHLDRLSALAAEHPDHDDVQRRLAQALLTVVNHESEAGRFDSLADRLDRLSALATDDPDNGAVQVPTMGSYFIALRHLAEAERFDAVAEAVEDLGTLARRPDGLTVGSKGKDVTELSVETGEHLLRAGRLDLFEAFAGVLADGLSGGRWRSISSDLFMTADTLVGEGVISMDEYARVVECCGD